MSDTVISPRWSLSQRLPPWKTLGTAVILVFLIWAFFSRRTMQFYASFLFLFYSFTNSMWISVVLLGVFQTLIMIPFRIINITKSKHIKDFETTIAEEKNEETQSFLIKSTTKSGNKVILYYLINFMVSLTSYVTMGRLFLTDFYTKRLDPWLLYDFVPYPDYPLQDLWFKIPFIRFENTRDLGWSAVIMAWVGILVITFLLAMLKRFMVKRNVAWSTPITAMLTGSTIILLIAAYFLMRNYPSSLSFAIFTGDVSKPLPALNLITALATFFTLMWLDIPTILKKGELAVQAKIEPSIIQKTQSMLFGESLRSAAVIGLGAYFVTNRIPCAFELSIFTLEIISWLSPLTLDRMILTTKPVAAEAEIAAADSPAA